MQNETAPDWHAQEVAKLQSEVDLLNCLLEAITLIGKAHEAPPGHRVIITGQNMDLQHCSCDNTQ